MIHSNNNSESHDSKLPSSPSTTPQIPANSRTQNKRYPKTRKPQTESFTQNANDDSSLDYSSSTLSNSKNRTNLRPSSIIHPKTNAQNRKQASTRITQEWAKIFSKTDATNKPNTSASIKQNSRPVTSNGKEHGYISIRGGVQTRIHTQNSYQPDNTPFGDNIEHNDDIACFLFHNINGVKDEAN
jgi:hypothetical protein